VRNSRAVLTGAVPRAGRADEEMEMVQGVRLFVVLLMMLWITAGCQTLTGKTAGETVDDATITAAVKSKLVADKATNLTRVDVDTNRGTVYLNGSVDSTEQKARAEQLAWQAKGVKSVVNNLQVHKR
jgi:hyperosmotically inducible protein